MTELLPELGYKPSMNARRRRLILKKGIRENCFDEIYEQLEEELSEAEGYYHDRIRSDKNWLKKRAVRFNTERFS